MTKIVLFRTFSNYHYRNLCRRGREKSGSGVPVYAFGGGTFLWFLPARRIVQRRSTGRGHADDSKDAGVCLDRCDGTQSLSSIKTGGVRR